ncbi:putative 28kDa heat-and acid-stable phosphoprotein [Helianthus annuus]|nr:putative 28kDa heat-and acid-stable phosphoprotein [Helianthus annuus]
MEKTTELSRREREEIEKERAHERYMKLQEQGKTEQARKDLERLALIRQQRADAAKKREEEKAGNVLDLLVFRVKIVISFCLGQKGPGWFNFFFFFFC